MYTLNCKGRLLVVDKPLVMGIINTTPDSFYEGSRFSEIDLVLKQAEKMVKEGADILDIGGQSTRPGNEQLSPEAESDRVISVIESLHYNFPDLILSVDTFYAAVARAAVNSGASIVNDVSGGMIDENMLYTVAELKVPYVCMHIKGSPSTMMEHTDYENLGLEVLDYFIAKTAICRQAGIYDIIIDPGFGFAKTIEQNFQLLRTLPSLSIIDYPILCGLSRKSTVYRTLGVPASEALNGSSVMHTIALLNGANILRVHDVKEAKEAVKLFLAYKQS